MEMNKEQIITKWKRCFGKNSFISTMNSIDNIEELIQFIEEQNCNIEELIISSVDLSYIPSLEAFTSLTFIDFSFNNLTTVEPLKELPILQTLLLAHNKLVSVDYLSTLNTLNILDVCFNSITSITTSPRLGNLRITNNPLKQLIQHVLSHVIFTKFIYQRNWKN